MIKPRFTFSWAVASALLLLTANAAPGAAWEPGFVTGFYDLPLMGGMTEVPDADVTFDTISGRIVIAFARSDRARRVIEDFYRTTLSQLGWRSRVDGSFEREGEVLSMDFLADGTNVIIQFSLFPK